ncbi:IPT/TIG domain-containing protein [Paenibacillus lautus]|uniref:Fibronectin type-III domain-containing protein n=1 Tax=Paenibacillus lautus TaxID=1401 RepID=A0A1R1B0B5_PAELA|nr:IPT/TIG domain-containing protein [Paenibacillus lautus]OME91639.1 hypothetical protein BK123_19530 [Paenibacillus lautus]
MFGKKISVFLFFFVTVFLFLGQSQVNAAGEQVIYSSTNGDQILMRDSVGEYFVNGIKISNNKQITWNRLLENTWVGGSFTREQNVQFIDGISEIKSVQFASFKSNYAQDVPHAFVLKVGHILMSCREAQFSAGEWNISFKDVFGNYTPRYTDYDGSTTFPSDGDSYLIINADTGKVVDFVSNLNPYYYGKAEKFEIINATEGSNSLEIPSVQPQLRLSEIQDNKAKISWNSVPYGLEYEVEFNSDTIFSNSNSIELKNMPPNTEYQARIRAKNDLGSGPWSQYLIFRTKLQTPEVTYSTTSSTLQLNWLPVEGAESYEVDFNGLIVQVGNVTEFVPAGIESNKEYTFAVRALSSNNESLWSPPVKILTPFISGLSPNYGLVAGNNLIDINGSNFVSGAKAQFGTTEVATTFVSSTKLRVWVPAASSEGSVNVKITNPDGQVAVLSNGYTYTQQGAGPAPTISGLSPNYGLVAGNNVIEINGSNFVNGAKAQFGTTEVPATFVSSTLLRAKVPAASSARSVDIKVTNPDGQVAVLSNGYKYVEQVFPAPTISGMSPSSGLVTGNNVIEINGSNFVSGATAQFGTTEVPATFVRSTLLRAKVPAASSAGSVDIKVTNPDGQVAVLSNGYKYVEQVFPAPTISSLSPSSGLVTGNNLIDINGSNFVSGATAQFGTTEVPATFVRSTLLRVKVPAASSAGSVDIKVTNPDGQVAVLLDGYTYTLPAPAPAPVITSISPNSGVLTGGNVVVINGANFLNGVNAQFGNVQVAATTFVSSNQLRVKVPAGISSGMVDITIINPDGKSAQLIGGYTYN